MGPSVPPPAVPCRPRELLAFGGRDEEKEIAGGLSFFFFFLKISFFKLFCHGFFQSFFQPFFPRFCMRAWFSKGFLSFSPSFFGPIKANCIPAKTTLKLFTFGSIADLFEQTSDLKRIRRNFLQRCLGRSWCRDGFGGGIKPLKRWMAKADRWSFGKEPLDDAHLIEEPKSP